MKREAEKAEARTEEIEKHFLSYRYLTVLKMGLWICGAFPVT